MKTSLTRAVANTLSFAHLASFGRGKSAKAEGDDKPKDDDPSASGAGAEGDDDDDPERKKRDDETDEEHATRMKKMDDDESAAAGGGSSAAAEDDDDDKDEEMRGNSAAAQARRREQARCAAIFASPAAGRNPVLAANLAFKSRMPRGEALAMLEGTPAPAAVSSNPALAARNPSVGAGPGAGPSSRQAASASMDRAFMKANPANAQRAAK
jgi:hypothetical protein